MKVWKSPVFYFGVILVLVVISALLAPFVMDWGRYRVGLEAYGQKLTGRKVEITGPIAVRLFPWPRLTADDVHIANPDDVKQKWFATADQVTVQMTLGALLNGTIQVESIDVQKPVVTLQLNQDGVGNWNFAPAEAIRNSRLLEHVMLDQITLHEGKVQLIDERRGSFINLDNLSGTLSAPNLTGPWRTSGTFGYDDLALAFSATTGAFAAGSPLHFGLRISSQENTGYSYFLDGETAASKFSGTVRLEPVVDPEGKGDTEGRIRPITFKSKVVADFDGIDLTEIEIRPADVSDQGTLLEGDAKFTIAKNIVVSANLAAPRADFDSLAGASSRQLLRDGGGLSLVNGLLMALPERIDLRSSLRVAALKAGGEILENVLLDVSANREAIRIHELSASLPGRSRSRFEGVFFPGTHYAELAGNLAVESADARALSMWLWPDSKSDIAKTWNGSRGHLKAKTDVTLTASKLDFPNIEYELDSEPGKAQFKTLVNGERPIVTVHIDTPNADIDNYLSNGLSTVSSSSGTSWLQLFGNFVADQVKRDLRLTLRAGALRLNGVEAKNVAVDVETTVQGFDLKTLEIDSVDGAKLSASGVVLSTPDGPDGEISATVTADDPRGLFQLAGILAREKNPTWTGELGKTNLKINLKARPSTTEPATGFSINGTIGELTISSDGSIVPALDLVSTALNGSAEINSTSSAALISLYGGTVAKADAIPGRLVVTADGNFRDGFLVDVDTSFLRSTVHYAGMLNPASNAMGLNGDLTLQARDAGELISALQIPKTATMSGALTLGGKVSSAGNKIGVEGIEGKFGDVAFIGAAALENSQRVSGDFTVDRVSLASLMAPVFLPWNGRPASLEQTFAKKLPLGLTGEVWVRPKILTVYSGLDVPDAQIGLTAKGDEIRIGAFAKTATGEKVSIELASKPGTDGQELTGHVTVPFNLAEQLKLVNGAAVISGAASVDLAFKAKGLSTGGALATLGAKGNFDVLDSKLLNISPQNFSKLIVNAKDADALRVAFDALHRGDGVSLGAVSGSINIVDGVATFSPFAVNGVDANVLMKPVVQLADGQVDLGVMLSLKALPNLPPMEVSYTGAPSQLVAHEDATALTSFLGFKVLEQGVVDLEKLQVEQQRLAREDEEMHRQDAEKLASFYAQKAELRLRLREMRVQADQRVLDLQLAAAEQLRLIQEGTAMNKLEIKQRLRELKAYRKAEIAVPVQKPKPKPVEVIQGPVLLVPLGSPQ